jgi:hypothetical protein
MAVGHCTVPRNGAVRRTHQAVEKNGENRVLSAGSGDKWILREREFGSRGTWLAFTLLSSASLRCPHWWSAPLRGSWKGGTPCDEQLELVHGVPPRFGGQLQEMILEEQTRTQMNIPAFEDSSRTESVLSQPYDERKHEPEPFPGFCDLSARRIKRQVPGQDLEGIWKYSTAEVQHHAQFLTRTWPSRNQARPDTFFTRMASNSSSPTGP